MTGIAASPPLSGIVLVQEASQYGAPTFKPANDLARLLADLARTRTLTWSAIHTIKAMGLTVQTTGAAPRQL